MQDKYFASINAENEDVTPDGLDKENISLDDIHELDQLLTDDLNRLVLLIVQSRQRFHKAADATQFMYYGKQTDHAVDALVSKFTIGSDPTKGRDDNVINVNFRNSKP